ncbi:MAG TPA: DUF2071 domain-containing protein, partial [Actinomycetota bacterium]
PRQEAVLKEYNSGVLTRLSVSIEVEDFALLTYRVPAERVREHLPEVYTLQTHEHDGEELCFVTTTCFRNRDFRPTATSVPRHTFYESTYRTYVDFGGLHGVYFLGRYLETAPAYLAQRAIARDTFKADFDVRIDKDENGYRRFECHATGPSGETSFSVTATDEPAAKEPWTSGEEHAQFLTFRPIGCFTSSVGLQMRGRVDHARMHPWEGRLNGTPKLELWEKLGILSRREATEPYSVLITEGTRFFLYPPVPVTATGEVPPEGVSGGPKGAPDRT